MNINKLIILGFFIFFSCSSNVGSDAKGDIVKLSEYIKSENTSFGLHRKNVVVIIPDATCQSCQYIALEMMLDEYRMDNIWFVLTNFSSKKKWNLRLQKLLNTQELPSNILLDRKNEMVKMKFDISSPFVLFITDNRFDMIKITTEMPVDIKSEVKKFVHEK